MRLRPFYRKCDEPGCTHHDLFEAVSANDKAETMRRPNFCLRHSGRSVTITPPLVVSSLTFTASRSPGCGEKLFWRNERTGQIESGFASGFGFQAWADEFQEGASIRVTVQVSAPPSAPAMRRGEKP